MTDENESEQNIITISPINADRSESVPNMEFQPNGEILSDDTANSSINGQLVCDRYGFYEGGDQFTRKENQGPMDIEKYRRREKKWVDMIKSQESWTKYMEKDFKRVKRRCYKGIPDSVRGKAWIYLTGAKGHEFRVQKPGAFEELASDPNIPSRVVEEIERDLHRQFPFHELFAHASEDIGSPTADVIADINTTVVSSASLTPQDGNNISKDKETIHNDHNANTDGNSPDNTKDSIAHRVSDSAMMNSSMTESFTTSPGFKGRLYLRKILRAYAAFRPKIGYCQAQAPIAAVLLMHMDIDNAFWCFVQVCDNYLRGYYAPDLFQVKFDGQMLLHLLRKISYPAYKHLKKYEIEPILFMTEWFMCIYTRTLPWESVLRILDVFFCEGVKVIFKVALVILKYTIGDSLCRKRCPGMMETISALRNIPPPILEADFLLEEIQKLPITTQDMERTDKKLKHRLKAESQRKKKMLEKEQRQREKEEKKLQRKSTKKEGKTLSPHHQQYHQSSDVSPSSPLSTTSSKKS